MHTIASIQAMSAIDWLTILTIGLLVFSLRLPEVGHGLARGVVEFKKSLLEMEDRWWGR